MKEATQMPEDKKLARQQVESDFRTSLLKMKRQLPADMPVNVVCLDDADRSLPPGDGEGLFAPVTIGCRDKLTKREARACAELWRKATRQYPKAIFYLNLLCYDQDPREVWEIVDAARYVRRWARFAGMDNIETALHFLGPASAAGTHGAVSLSFLAACGCFGDEMKQAALRGFNPTTAQ
jgi:hypothetical protein